MRKLSTLLTLLLVASGSIFAGGIVTNTNQSVQYVRMVARDASTEIDAVYFNPAGLTKLDDGFYVSLHNTYIYQTRTIESNYPYLNESEFTGEATAPVFPDIYAAYKTGKWAISLGINPIGGGGTATYENGLPSFEMAASDLVPSFATQGVTGYSLEAYLEGSSVYWGYQLGVSYEINDMISVYAGARYVTAKNTYEGYLRNIEVDLGGTPMRADAFLLGVATTLSGTASSLQPFIDGGAGGFTLAEAAGAGLIDAATQAALEVGFTSAGLDPATATISEGQTQFMTLAAQNTAGAALLGDQTADVEQTGSGFTPIIGVNISPNDKMNIGLKYEFKTTMELENKTAQDFTVGLMPDGTPVTMFPDGEKFHNDMPALLSVGIDYKLTDKFLVATGFHFSFDKNANYGKKLNGDYVDNDEIMDANAWEWALGLQYNITDKFLLSAGYLRTQSGVDPDLYQSDLSYSLRSNSVAFGGAYTISPMIAVNLGVFYTMYVDGDKNFDRTTAMGTTQATTETYDKSNLLIGLGLDFKLGGNKSE